MVTEGVRRSGRARKQITSYADEQAEETERAAELASTKTKRKRQIANDKADEPKVMSPSTVSEDDEPPEVEEPVKKRGKKTSTKKKKKLTKETAKDANELYGAPPPGTKIPLVNGAFRKQPKLYYVPEQRWQTKKVSSSLNDESRSRIARTLAAIPRLAEGQAETRLRNFKNGPTETYETALEKALSQKMFVIERTRGIEDDCHANHDDCPYETLKIAGSTGNVYEIRISHLMTCTCPVGLFVTTGEPGVCKHALYVLYNVLKAPHRLRRLPALLTTELKEIFANAPPLPFDLVEEDEKDGKRKEVDGDCPICFMDFEEGEDIVWCRAACGNNIHKKCFDQWAKAKFDVTCPFCRTPWVSEEDSKKQKSTISHVRATETRDRGGYLNVRDQLEYD